MSNEAWAYDLKLTAKGCCNERILTVNCQTTPLHATKLPLRVWLKAMWLMLQSDKGLSSVRLAEALGVSQPTAWRMGHALRLMVAREHMLDSTVEIDHFHLGGRPKKRPDDPPPGRGRKGQANTQKTPVMAMVQRPTSCPSLNRRLHVGQRCEAQKSEPRVLVDDVNGWRA